MSRTVRQAMGGCIEHTSAPGPTLPTWALQQVGSYPGYTGRDANVVATAALDPLRKSRPRKKVVTSRLLACSEGDQFTHGLRANSTPRCATSRGSDLQRLAER